MKKNMMSLLMIMLLMVSLVGCATTDATEVTYSFKSIITSIDGLSTIVAPNEGEEIRKSGDKVIVYFADNEDAKKFNVGDEITVTYDGEIRESYPLQINVISIKKEGGIKVDFERIPISQNDGKSIYDTVGITSDGKEFTRKYELSEIENNNKSEDFTGGNEEISGHDVDSVMPIDENGKEIMEEDSDKIPKANKVRGRSVCHIKLGTKRFSIEKLNYRNISGNRKE
ncbi:DUF3221 domain-containing protein [Wukongibacter sp. M2B1]|uniref:DUF3221 domain-containing protein n=1 Tax=Wukongibacter sp. M2B1 TaxID=3088895 RepID=UPI003D7B87B4